jgi:hypothetical protein
MCIKVNEACPVKDDILPLSTRTEIPYMTIPYIVLISPVQPQTHKPQSRTLGPKLLLFLLFARATRDVKQILSEAPVFHDPATSRRQILVAIVYKTSNVEKIW